MKLTTLIILALASVCYSQEIPVTFNVDMNGTGLPAKDSVLNVSLRGSLEPLNWSSGIKMTDDNRDGIYSATVIFGGKENKELIFKYVVNSYEWEAGENMTLQIAKSQMPYNSKFRYVARPGNPFRKFIGEWTLKEDNWSQGYGKDIEIIIRFVKKLIPIIACCGWSILHHRKDTFSGRIITTKKKSDGYQASIHSGAA